MKNPRPIASKSHPGEYKVRLRHPTSRRDTVPPGLNEDLIRLISGEKARTRVHARVRLKAYRYWAKLAKSQAEPKWANHPLSAHRLSGDQLLFGAQGERRSAQSLEEVGPGAAQDV